MFSINVFIAWMWGILGTGWWFMLQFLKYDWDIFRHGDIKVVFSVVPVQS